MVVIAFTIDGNHRYNWRKNRPSLFVNWIRPRTWVEAPSADAEARHSPQPRSQVSRSQDVSWQAAEHQASQSADQSLDVRAHAGPFLFHWLSVDRWRPLRSAAGCSRTLPGGGVRRRGRRGWHVIAKCEDGNSGHHDPDDKCRQEPSAAVSVTERSLSVGVQAWIGLLRLSVGRLAIDHLFPLPVVGPTRL